MNAVRRIDHRGIAVRVLDRLDEGEGRWPALLAPCSWIWRCGVALDRLLRPRRALPGAPLSLAVGNLRVGGTGKTPVTAWLARRLEAEGWKVAVVSRGFRAGREGDEPQWVRERSRARVILSEDRRRGFAEARAQGAQIVLFDDALQSKDQATLRAAIVLDRDLLHPPRVLPAGPLREPMDRLRAVDRLWVRQEGDEEPGVLLSRARQWCPEAAVFRLTPAALVDSAGVCFSLESARERGPCLLVSGLARPASFEADALRVGARAIASLRWPDHAEFNRAQAREIETRAAATGASWILCPEKNLVRLARLDLSLPLLALQSTIEWRDGSDPLEWIRGHLGGQRNAADP